MNWKKTVAQLQMQGGMAFVLSLSDGSAIVIDGGEATDEACYETNKTVLYNYLKRFSPNGKIRVAMWVITHFHSDHVDVAARFLEEYREEMEIESFLYNKVDGVECFTDSERDEELTREAAWERAMSLYPNARRIEPRGGDRLVLSGLAMDILATARDPYPKNATNANALSSVIRFTFDGGGTFMCLGDACGGRLTALVDPESGIYASDELLKSDILQVAHHGLAVGRPEEYPSITELYRRIAPSVALWAINEKRFLTDKWCRDEKHTYHKFLFDTVGKNNHSNSYTTVIDMDDMSISFEKSGDGIKNKTFKEREN